MPWFNTEIIILTLISYFVLMTDDLKNETYKATWSCAVCENDKLFLERKRGNLLPVLFSARVSISSLRMPSTLRSSSLDMTISSLETVASIIIIPVLKRRQSGEKYIIYQQTKSECIGLLVVHAKPL